MARTIQPTQTFGKKCTIKDRTGEYWVVRQARNSTRVFPVGADAPGEGDIVKSADLLTVIEYKPEPAAEAETEAAANTAETAPEATTEAAPENVPAEVPATEPVTPAPEAAAPAETAPIATPVAG